MPKENRGNASGGSGSSGEQRRQERDGSYSPEWIKKSRDDVPANDQPLPANPVVEAIISGAVPSNQNTDQPQQPSPSRGTPDQAPVESEG